jgi:hypothetical protein
MKIEMDGNGGVSVVGDTHLNLHSPWGPLPNRGDIDIVSEDGLGFARVIGDGVEERMLAKVICEAPRLLEILLLTEAFVGKLERYLDVFSENTLQAHGNLVAKISEFNEGWEPYPSSW